MQENLTVNESDQPTDMRAWLNMVESLSLASAWPAGEAPIEVIQTHISVVLLSRRRALKLKKPVDFGFLDYTTLEKRRLACEAEISLNRRLCPDIYLGVQTITEVEGKARISSAGRVLDYGVLMKRLPAERMLDQMVKRDEVTEEIIDRVADRLSRFHREARRGPEVDVYGSVEVIRQNWEENFTQTSPYVGRTISAADFDSIRAWVNGWMEERAESLRGRVRDGWIRDGHGDLRCESVCVTDGICVFDCIEFNDRFRCCDVASEAAFLAMDLDARGRPDLGYYFCERYQTRSADRELFTLLPFYRCYRAYVRGKVLSFRLDEPEFSEAEKERARSRAETYFDLARRYATPLKNPTIILVAGLSGTGKTAVARAIGGELGLRVVSADAVRHSLFGDAKRPSAYGEGPYGDEANRLTYRTLIERGRAILKEERGVILDATFQRAADRKLAQEMAAEAGAKWRLIECRLSPQAVNLRLAHRAALRDGQSDATWEIYSRQRGVFEPIDADPSHLPLDTGRSLSETSRTATGWLREIDSNIQM